MSLDQRSDVVMVVCSSKIPRGIPVSIPNINVIVFESVRRAQKQGHDRSMAMSCRRVQRRVTRGIAQR